MKQSPEFGIMNGIMVKPENARSEKMIVRVNRKARRARQCPDTSTPTLAAAAMPHKLRVAETASDNKSVIVAARAAGYSFDATSRLSSRDAPRSSTTIGQMTLAGTTCRLMLQRSTKTLPQKLAFASRYARDDGRRAGQNHKTECTSTEKHAHHWAHR